LMDAYFDSAIIVKLYVREATSPEAIRLAGAYIAPYWLTQWQALEVKNAIRLKTFRNEITAAEMNQSIAAFEQDIATGRWQRPVYVAAAVEQKADELSASHSAILGCRTLDIIHVAAALVIGVKEFITFDGRQGAVAKRAGLTVKP
jgi:predicted nucleic acid-binding protein